MPFFFFLFTPDYNQPPTNQPTHHSQWPLVFLTTPTSPRPMLALLPTTPVATTRPLIFRTYVLLPYKTPVSLGDYGLLVSTDSVITATTTTIEPDANYNPLQQIDGTVGVMRDNINKMVERGEQLDNIQDKTDNLAQAAQGFRKGANRVRKDMWWKDMKMRMCLIAGVIIIIIVIVVPIATHFSK